VTTPVNTFLIETATSGTTAPEESITAPLSSPVFAFWALARGANKIAAISNNMQLYGRSVFPLII
jgi:hypothetical protein